MRPDGGWITFVLDGGTLEKPENRRGLDLPDPLHQIPLTNFGVNSQQVVMTFQLNRPAPGADPNDPFTRDNYNITLSVVPDAGTQHCGGTIPRLSVQQARGLQPTVLGQFETFRAPDSCTIEVTRIDLDAGIVQGTFLSYGIPVSSQSPQDAGIIGVQLLDGTFDVNFR